jgi:hypothetical protein
MHRVPDQTVESPRRRGTASRTVDLELMDDPQESSFGNIGGHVSVLFQNINGAKVTLDRARDLGSRLIEGLHGGII